MNKVLLVIVGIVIVISTIVANSTLFTVHQASQALVLQFGKPVDVERDPGLKFKVPFVQNVEYFDRRILDLDPQPQEVILQDQKRVNVDSFARYRIVDPLEFRKKVVVFIPDSFLYEYYPTVGDMISRTNLNPFLLIS